jgi:hypothetical protein
MSDTDPDACSKTDKLPNPSHDFLNMIWKTMQEDKIEQDRGRLETDGSRKRREGKKKQTVKEIEGRLRKD